MGGVIYDRFESASIEAFFGCAGMGDMDFSYVVLPEEKVPESSIKIWKQRGYDPAAIGTVHIKFSNKSQEYIYPSYFWSE